MSLQDIDFKDTYWSGENKEGSLTREKIYAVLSEPKGNQREKISINLDKIRTLIPEDLPASRYEDYIFSILSKN